MNRLIEEMIKPILEANSNIKKVVGIYGGRFQPFGPHHLKTYKWLEKQVDDAYITTSNIKKPPRHPMNFKEKVRHMSQMGVKSNHISLEKSPFVAKNLEKKFDPETTAFVYVFGAKDAGRLGGGKYFQDYKKNKGNIEGFDKHGYYLTAPHVSISVGGKEVSGTSMRELLGSPKIDDSERGKLFKKMFGYFNDGLFKMMTNKFKKLFEGLENDPNTSGDNIKFDFAPEEDGEDDILMDLSESKKEFVIWGIPPGKNSEQILYTKAKSNGEAKKILKVLVSNHGIKKGRIQVLDLEQDPSAFWKSGDVFEDINIKKRDGKDSGDYRTYTAPEDSDIDEPYKRDTTPTDGKEEKLKKENVTLPIKVGDTLLMGRFKNKRVKIKTITTNEKGDLLINGRTALKFRMPDGGKVLLPKPPEISANPYDDIEEIIQTFLTTIDVNEIINEVTSTATSGKQAVDSGPSALMKGIDGYAGRNKIEAEKLGWEIVNYILDVDVKNVPPFKGEFDDRESVSYLPAGIGTGATPNNPENLTGAKGYNKWKRNMKKIAQNVGFELMNFMDKDEKERKKQIAKDTKATLKQQKSDEKGIPVEPMGESFSKDWWKKNLTEKIVTKTVLKPRRKGLLLMGGAYGHMAHPFDDKDLTFGDLKKIIEDGLGGTLNREDNVTEKLDGQNIMVSWRDGKLIAARNKGHIKNAGATALDAKAVASKFAGRGDIKNAFVYAMKDLGKSIGSLSEKQRVKIFDNGHNFMNLEVIWPKSANVVDYDLASLVFHGALQYDDNGSVRGEVKGSGRILAGMIQQVNQHIQKHYKIGKPQFLTLSKHTDFGKLKSKFLSSLSRYQSKFGLKDSDTLGLYHQKWWEQFIIKKSKGSLSSKVLKGLVKRWAFFDKSYAVKDIRNDIKDEKILDWVLSFDKNDHAKQVKLNMKPFEELFFEVGAEIMKNISDWMAVNPDSTVQRMKKKLDSSISTVRKGGDLKKLNTLKAQLDKLQAIGGVNAIVPSEGIVFKYNGKTYKFTGAFAPINQITGLISF